MYLGSVLFNGRLMQANSNYGCFMTFSTSSVTEAKIPKNFKVSIRSVRYDFVAKKMLGELLMLKSAGNDCR